MISSMKYLAIAMLTLGLVAEIVSAVEGDYESMDKQLFNKDAPLLSKSENLKLLKSLLPLAEQNNAGNPKINTIKRLIEAASPDREGCHPMGFDYLFALYKEFSTPNLEAYAATCRKEQLDICRQMLVENIASFSQEEKSVIGKFDGKNFIDVSNSLTEIIKEKTGPKRPLLEKHRVNLFEQEYNPVAALCDAVSDKIEPLTQIFAQFRTMPEIHNDSIITEWSKKADFCHEVKNPHVGDSDYLSNRVFNLWL